MKNYKRQRTKLSRDLYIPCKLIKYFTPRRSSILIITDFRGNNHSFHRLRL